MTQPATPAPQPAGGANPTPAEPTARLRLGLVGCGNHASRTIHPSLVRIEDVQIVAACDLAIAGEHARFGLSGVNYGLFCSTPLVAVGRVAPRKQAMEMALTGSLYSAQEAERFGLVNRVVPEGRALEEALALARTIANHSAPTLAIGKRAFYAQIERPLDEAYALASLAMIDNLAEPDSVEGLGAFLDKRRPVWGS